MTGISGNSTSSSTRRSLPASPPRHTPHSVGVASPPFVGAVGAESPSRPVLRTATSTATGAVVAATSGSPSKSPHALVAAEISSASVLRTTPTTATAATAAGAGASPARRMQTGGPVAAVFHATTPLHPTLGNTGNASGTSNSSNSNSSNSLAGGDSLDRLRASFVPPPLYDFHPYMFCFILNFSSPRFVVVVVLYTVLLYRILCTASLLFSLIFI